jgi:3-phenylpropionate/trans-cinnamate dioxygenase ferredoxin component
VGGDVIATANICTHAFARLSDAFLDGAGIECAIHQVAFDVKTGAVTSGPADAAPETYPARIAGDDIGINVQSKSAAKTSSVRCTAIGGR